MSCACKAPRESANPRSAGRCSMCGREIDPEILSSDKNVRWFFDSLARTFPGGVTPAFHEFRYECEMRERAGRERFGLQYLHRDNLAEGREEHCDGALYAYLDILQSRAFNGEEEDLDLALTEAWHLYKAYECNRRRVSKRHGSP